MKLVSEIRRRLVVARAESQYGQSELYSFRNPKPMQVPEQMSDVVVLASATHKTRRSVKHGLEEVQQVTR